MLTRREFMKSVVKTIGVTTGVAFFFTAKRPDKAAAAAASAKAILYDMTVCRGCKACEVVCRKYYNLPRIEDEDDSNQGGIPPMKPEEYTRVEKLDCTNGEGDPRFIKWQCMHCVEPTCATVCPTSALRKTESGPVVYDETRCIGCQCCVSGCPFSIPQYDWEGDRVVTKCCMCAERLAEGKKPVCVENCPSGALRYGDRDSIVAQARQMEADGRYVFGIDEFGGTSWIYVSDIPFDEIGFPSADEDSYPSISKAMFGSQTATLVAGVAALGLYSLYLRKKKIGEEEN